LLDLSSELAVRVKQQMDKAQREHFLNAHVKSTQKELGDEEGRDGSPRSRTRSRRPSWSKEAREKASLQNVWKQELPSQ
jgi:ATP-dependent Lon protease